ncbi:MAG: hypothetical protein HOE90_16050 [Bacteriovoracaceae bacterium]|jgi:hypothetical protein|nr:hypothetical protein [Bacteriovoracaceae bacterium]
MKTTTSALFTIFALLPTLALGSSANINILSDFEKVEEDSLFEELKDSKMLDGIEDIDLHLSQRGYSDLDFREKDPTESGELSQSHYDIEQSTPTADSSEIPVTELDAGDGVKIRVFAGSNSQPRPVAESLTRAMNSQQISDTPREIGHAKSAELISGSAPIYRP